MSYIYTSTPYEVELNISDNCNVNNFSIAKSGKASIIGGNISGGEIKNVENLYEVIMTNDIREILLDKKVIAKNEEVAKFRAGVYKYLEDKLLQLDYVSVIVNSLGVVKTDKDLIN